MSRSSTSHAISAVACSLLLLCGCHDNAQPSAPLKSATTRTTAVNRIASGPAVRAYIDPATGQLRDPTPEELAVEAAQQTQKKQAASATTTTPSTSSTPREVVLPNGAIEVTLDPAAQHALIACIQKDGSVKMDHECEADRNGAAR